MPTYVALFNWTDQEVRTAKDSVQRYEQGRAAMEQMGVTLQTILWTQGRYDLVAVFEAPDEETVAAAMLGLAAQGTLRTETLRAFTAEEMGRVLQKLG